MDKMNIEKLYETIENMKSFGFSITKEIQQQVDECEEQLIKTEVVPTLINNSEPLLTKIKRDLVLMIEYHPGEPINVAISHKANMDDFQDIKPLTNRTSAISSTPVSVEPYIPSKHIENPTKGLKVTFQDGTVLCENTAVKTFVKTLQIIGFERVEAVDIKHGATNDKYNLVGHQCRDPKKNWQYECEGWFVYTNLSNEVKCADLKKISDFYNLGLVIEEGKPID